MSPLQGFKLCVLFRRALPYAIEYRPFRAEKFWTDGGGVVVSHKFGFIFLCGAFYRSVGVYAMGKMMWV